eukprot:12919505-Prorocentrum_lima.AAC.1
MRIVSVIPPMLSALLLPRPVMLVGGGPSIVVVVRMEVEGLWEVTGRLDGRWWSERRGRLSR